MPARRILLDTNALVFSVKNKLDLVKYFEDDLAGSSIRIEVPTGVISELGNISNAGNKKDSAAAGVAIRMLRAWIAEDRVHPVRSDRTVDDWLILQGKTDPDVSVCTYDAELKEYLKKLGVQIITPRGRSRH